MESNSMPILADAVAKDGRFAGLHQLDLVGEKDKFDVSPLLEATTAEHKCPILKSLDISSDDRSAVALRDAFAAGAFPAVTILHTPEFEEEEVDVVISFFHVLEARATAMKFYLDGQDLPHAAFQVLADALSTPALLRR